MKKRALYVYLFVSILAQIWTIHAADDDDQISASRSSPSPQATSQPSALVPFSNPFADMQFSTPLPSAPTVDVSSARVKLGQSSATLKSIGGSAESEYHSIESNCKKLDEDLAGISKPSTSTSVVVAPGYASGIFAPTWWGDALLLPKDPVDKFDHNRWARNLSVYYHVSSPHPNRTARFNITAYSSTDLTDNLYVGARHCTSHYDAAGHSYTGAGHCCQWYVRGIREELIDIAAFASRHSRAHENYVAEFNRFERQVALLDNQARSLAAAHGYVLPAPVAYSTQLPVNRYTPFRFTDWLLEIAPNNSAAEIRDFTDLDNPAVMAEKVYVSCRNSTCGSGTGHQYTSYNYCGTGHTRALKIEMFEVAKRLATNQTYHDEYVRQAKLFEDFARRGITGYWAGWSGVPSPLFLANGGTVMTSSGVSADASYQSLKSNRDQLRSHLTKAVEVLKSASRCSVISDEVGSSTEALCHEIDSYAAAVNQQRTQDEFFKAQVRLLKGQIQQNQGLLSTADSDYKELKKENEQLKERLRKEDWEARERALEKKFEERLAKQSEEQGRSHGDQDRKAVAFLLGRTLYELNRGQNPTDFTAFDSFSLEQMAQTAQYVIVEKLKSVLAQSK